MDDAFLKRTFAHARPVELLIRRHLPKWAGKVDFSLDLPQVVLGLAGTSAFRRMRAELPALLRLVKTCGDEDFERYMARTVRALLRSRGIHSEDLEEAMTMDTVAAAFRRSLEEYKQECREEGMRRGREQGVRQGREQGMRQGREQGQVRILRQLAARKFGPEGADEVSRQLVDARDPVTIARISEAILDCDGAEEFLACVRG